ncbi:MAG TPA: ribosome biogenesis GTPase Der [Spirochaetota bacterium]|nr:ribosome biogenesis GTPase Der [Spirochaetota bacterium]HOS32702.1 ribosome biogenesis GTPase Der [Spirochaetota bacterium]HOS55856.1 ribosome biogenesis GTPase Der [Spirochaetota bacterium]HPK61847.1 ribosome biogenesis GTPase Der [Spirochaetota bacterium]HQF78433.1 ribosome biogenesis GTPase Der [Spirochaetota bacterium]
MDEKKSQISVLKKTNLPILAIVGRPNVGKSTLFNRLIKKRKAIIDPTPGVTRDLIFDECFFNNKKFIVIDTGGLTDEEGEINKFVQKKSLESLKIADVVLFLVEANNPLPIETDYVDIIKKSGKRYLLAVNKCDSKDKEQTVSEFYSYGLGEPIPISATHNLNLDILEKKIAEFELGEKSSQADDDEKKIIKLAIVGKPNVGKSSLLNRIVGSDRSIVSDIPGTTRDVVDETIVYKNNYIQILDTAGIRRKSKVFEDVEYYSVNRAIKTIESADITILLIDSLEDVSEQDKKITDQIVKNGKGLIIALNKWDLQEDTAQNIKEKKEKLLFKFPVISYAPILPISAKYGKGINEILNLTLKIYKALNKRIDTPKLNDFINETIKKYNPTSKKGVIKIYYGVQTSCAPTEFVFFINKKSLLSESYKNYIVNKFREKFDYRGIPIKISFRDKKK